LGLLVYGDATGVSSSRKIERATSDSGAFRFIAANDRSDHDTIAAFRRRFLTEIEKLFVEELPLARELGVLKMGAIGLDRAKIPADASGAPSARANPGTGSATRPPKSSSPCPPPPASRPKPGTNGDA
jgi:transposase